MQKINGPSVADAFFYFPQLWLKFQFFLTHPNSQSGIWGLSPGQYNFLGSWPQWFSRIQPTGNPNVIGFSSCHCSFLWPSPGHYTFLGSKLATAGSWDPALITAQCTFLKSNPGHKHFRHGRWLLVARDQSQKDNQWNSYVPIVPIVHGKLHQSDKILRRCCNTLQLTSGVLTLPP